MLITSIYNLGFTSPITVIPSQGFEDNVLQTARPKRASRTLNSQPSVKPDRIKLHKPNMFNPGSLRSFVHLTALIRYQCLSAYTQSTNTHSPHGTTNNLKAGNSTLQIHKRIPNVYTHLYIQLQEQITLYGAMK